MWSKLIVNFSYHVRSNLYGDYTRNKKTIRESKYLKNASTILICRIRRKVW